MLFSSYSLTFTFRFLSSHTQLRDFNSTSGVALEANFRAQLAEKVSIVFGKSKSKKGGYWEYRVSHENLSAYLGMYEQYLSLKEQESEWRQDHPRDVDSGFKKMMTVYEQMLDKTDFFFTIRTKLWLLSLCEDERKDMSQILEQLNNEAFWENLFNWRQMAKKVGEADLAISPKETRI